MYPCPKPVTHRLPSRFRPTRLALSVGCALAAASLTMAPDAQARVTSITLDPIAPAFGGYSFGTVGSYVRLTGTAHGELDPADPKNALIVDIGNAPTVGGKVPYSFNFYILAPANSANANHKAMYEPPNRGRKLAGGFLRIAGDPAGGNDPANATDFANSWALNQGYTLIWSGWDFSAGTGTANFNAWINVPIAKDAGATITGPSFEYFVTTSSSASTTLPLTYPAATLDKTQAKLTHRVHLDDVPQDVPSSGWNYNATGKAVSLVPAGFVPNDIYEFSYTAKDPTVNGIGFAAVRDFNSFLRHGSASDGNPVAADALERIYTYTV